MVTYSHKQIDEIRDEQMGGYESVIRTVREYDDDRHRKMMTARQQHMLFGRVPNTMSDNVIKLVITSLASLLEFEEWTVAAPRVDERGDPETIEEIEAAEEEVHPVHAFLAELYMRNQLRKNQYHVHRAAIRDADHAVSLAPLNGRVRLFRERWWDGESGVFIAYDRNGEYEFAVREWAEPRWRSAEAGDSQSIKRRNVYYPDHFIRCYQDGNTWAPIRERDTTLPGDDEPRIDGSVRWEKGAGDPLGIPIVHFSFDNRGDGHYGRSDVAGLLGLQDELNSIQHDITAASKFTGFQEWWGKLLGLKSELQRGPGRVHEFNHPDAHLESLPPGDTSSLTNAHAYKRKTMATNSETPMPSIDGAQWPTGEALLQFRMPQFKKATRALNSFGPSWTMVAHRAVEIANTFYAADLDEDAPITSIFADVRQLDEITVAKSKEAEARAMEIVSRIQDMTLIEQLEWLDVKTLEKLRRERGSFGPTGDVIAGEF